jgi:propanol-preferring alcohol dehydrogenase
VGGREDLAEAIAFAAKGKIHVEISKAPLEEINQVFADLKEGAIKGRIVITL